MFSALDVGVGAGLLCLRFLLLLRVSIGLVLLLAVLVAFLVVRLLDLVLISRTVGLRLAVADAFCRYWNKLISIAWLRL